MYDRIAVFMVNKIIMFGIGRFGWTAYFGTYSLNSYVVK